MTYEQLEIIIKALAVIVSVIVTFIIKPYIDSKITATEQAKIENYIRIAVRCAEQIYTPEEWAEKKAYVLNYVTNILNESNLVNIELSPADIENLIEGIVFEVKHE